VFEPHQARFHSPRKWPLWTGICKNEVLVFLAEQVAAGVKDRVLWFLR